MYLLQNKIIYKIYLANEAPKFEVKESPTSMTSGNAAQLSGPQWAKKGKIKENKKHTKRQINREGMCERESERERDNGHTVPGGVTAPQPTQTPTSCVQVSYKIFIIQNNTILACLHFKPAGKKFDSLTSNTYTRTHTDTESDSNNTHADSITHARTHRRGQMTYARTPVQAGAALRHSTGKKEEK